MLVGPASQTRHEFQTSRYFPITPTPNPPPNLPHPSSTSLYSPSPHTAAFPTYQTTHTAKMSDTSTTRDTPSTSPPTTPSPLPTPAQPRYIFTWTCPNPPCHSLHPSAPLPPFHDPISARQYDERRFTSWRERNGKTAKREGFEEVEGQKYVDICPLTCTARQIFECVGAATVRNQRSETDEWGVVLARCWMCGGRAGRGSCVGEIRVE